MKQLILPFVFSFFLFHAQAQAPVSDIELSITYLNRFQDCLYTQPNADSALYYAEKLASKEVYLPQLRDLIHNSFSQVFTTKQMEEEANTAERNRFKQREIFSRELLVRMTKDSLAGLRQTVHPLYLFYQCRQAENPQQLASLTNEFMKEELQPGEFYENKSGRYGLLIYQLIAKEPQLEALSHKLFSAVENILAGNQISSQVTVASSLSRQDLEKRAWYRYLYAYANSIKAQETGNDKDKEFYLKKAFDYSPDLTDKNHKASYFYDMIALLGEEKESFGDDYLSFLTGKAGSKQQRLQMLLQIALTDPTYKKDLETCYNSNPAPGKSFALYWSEAVDSSAKPAIAISFPLLNHQTFSSHQLSGKWILVDFWGTWCSPCRAEHPDLQTFYDSTVLHNTTSLALLTIACHDRKSSVQSYLEKGNFSFPVAMSDDKIENLYSVQGYPTKILITPKGKYVTVPFGVDWMNFVKEYCSL